MTRVTLAKSKSLQGQRGPPLALCPLPLLLTQFLPRRGDPARSGSLKAWLYLTSNEIFIHWLIHGRKRMCRASTNTGNEPETERKPENEWKWEHGRGSNHVKTERLHEYICKNVAYWHVCPNVYSVVLFTHFFSFRACSKCKMVNMIINSQDK